MNIIACLYIGLSNGDFPRDYQRRPVRLPIVCTPMFPLAIYPVKITLDIGMVKQKTDGPPRVYYVIAIRNAYKRNTIK